MSFIIPVEAGVCGFFQFEKVRLDDLGNEVSRIPVTDVFANLITDQGLNRMGDNDDWLTACQVGTGDTAPANTDTGLAAYLAGTTTIQNVSNSAGGTPPNYYIQKVKVFRFGTGVAAGNIAEVGVAWATTGSTLYSRALILDGLGVPTTITVLPDEVLDVSYIHRIYPPTADVVVTLPITGSGSHDIILRAAAVTALGGNQPGWGFDTNGSPAGYRSITSNSQHTAVYTGAIGAVTTIPSGTVALGIPGLATASNSSYGSNTLFRDSSLVWELNGGNLGGGIMSMLFSFSWASYQVQFTPNILKDNTKQLSFVLRQSWTRAVI